MRKSRGKNQVVDILHKTNEFQLKNSHQPYTPDIDYHYYYVSSLQANITRLS